MLNWDLLLDLSDWFKKKYLKWNNCYFELKIGGRLQLNAASSRV